MEAKIPKTLFIIPQHYDYYGKEFHTHVPSWFQFCNGNVAMVHVLLYCNILIIRNDGHWISVLGRLLLPHWAGRSKPCPLSLSQGNALS